MNDADTYEPPSMPTMRGGGNANALGRIDQYDLLRKLGGGGFGVVYLALDTTSGVEVALKTLHPLLKSNAEEMEQLREKFRLVSRLAHTNIATALVLHPCQRVEIWDETARAEMRLSPGDSVMVMRYAPGVTLSKWRRQFPGGVVPLDVTLEIARQIASALDYAHGERIVHRDIKPGNIMVETVTTDGGESPNPRLRVRILDFGLAAEIRSSMSRVSTEQGDTSGTRPYMAPEQWLGRKQDGRTDQYALACVVYELLSGAPPFAGVFETGDPVIMRTAVERDLPEEIEDVPASVNAALFRALAKVPKDRFGSCGEFVESCLAASPNPETRTPERIPPSETRIPQGAMARSPNVPQEETPDTAMSEAEVLRRRLLLNRAVKAIGKTDREDNEFRPFVEEAELELSVAEDACKFGRFGAAGESLSKVQKALDALSAAKAVRKAHEEEVRKAWEEADRRAKEEAARKAREEAACKAREEAERKARVEVNRKARREAVRKAMEEAERKDREEAERKRIVRTERRRKLRMVVVCIGSIITIGFTGAGAFLVITDYKKAEERERPQRSSWKAAYTLPFEVGGKETEKANEERYKIAADIERNAETFHKKVADAAAKVLDIDAKARKAVADIERIVSEASEMPWTAPSLDPTEEILIDPPKVGKPSSAVSSFSAASPANAIQAKALTLLEPARRIRRAAKEAELRRDREQPAFSIIQGKSATDAQCKEREAFRDQRLADEKAILESLEPCRKDLAELEKTRTLLEREARTVLDAIRERKAAEEKERQRNLEAARKQQEADERTARIQRDRDEVVAKRMEVEEYVRAFDYARAVEILSSYKDKFSAAEANEDMRNLIDRYQKLADLRTFLLEDLHRNGGLKWGLGQRDIEDADPAAGTITARGGATADVAKLTLKQWMNIINSLVARRDPQRSRIGITQEADLLFGAAIFCLEHGGGSEGAKAMAVNYAKAAIAKSEMVKRDLPRVLPELASALEEKE